MKHVLVAAWDLPGAEGIVWAAHFHILLAVCWPGRQSALDNHALACNFAKYSPTKKIYQSQSQQ